MCGNSAWLNELYIKWQKHAIVCFQADDIMRFMGRKLHVLFNGSITTDVKVRPLVTRIKQGVQGNRIKMYNKNWIVLRVETVINRPGEFRVFTFGRGRKAGYYQPMRKRVTNMKRYAEVCLRANRAYLDALTPVDYPTDAYRELTCICEPLINGTMRLRDLNPSGDDYRSLFEAVIRCEHHIHGSKSNEIGSALGFIYANDPVERRRQNAKVNRKLRLLRSHGLITRHGKSRRYRITKHAHRHMNAAIILHQETMPILLKKAA